MAQTKISFHLNEIFKYIVVFLIYFVWISYNYNNFLHSVIFSAILSAITCFFLTRFFYKKQIKEKISKADFKQIKESTTQLLFSQNDDVIKFFKNVFDKKTTPCKQEKHYLVLYPDTDYAVLAIPNYTERELNENHVSTYYKLAKALKITKVLVLAPSFTQNTHILTSQIMEVNFVLYNQEQVYSQLLKPTSCYPDKVVMFKNKQQTTFKTFFLMLVNKRNSKHYFYSSLFMIFASLFVQLKSYYIVFSSVFLILTLFSFYSEYLFTEPRFNNIVKETAKQTNHPIKSK